MSRNIIAIPIVSSGINKYVFPHFGKAPSFAIVEVMDKSFRILYVIQNQYRDHMHGKGHEVIKMLVENGVDTVIVSDIGYGAFQQLKEYNIRIYKLPEKSQGLYSLEEALKMFIDGSLKELEEPSQHNHHHHY
ncbi:NifB/NifX family molybdenum-iron cluster-binding protein [Ignisphaera sp. 4213-co]|uniref:NifB/NifX family molybdenum-iron cluster-binding protein n=1 Tax=Ignisphaera cupida TaxID=3050454 RepID=A0ABD4Z5A7_9CREN|nr:NifB/NifX family molybdenum-iron cluster-binding protein [Ignisphaera sp. 4213-co]MDK6028123.1 NifB/NifX family molybdenum-iron cluster-binding protein [Ignisphaera sp. 4213-co]